MVIELSYPFRSRAMGLLDKKAELTACYVGILEEKPLPAHFVEAPRLPRLRDVPFHVRKRAHEIVVPWIMEHAAYSQNVAVSDHELLWKIAAAGICKEKYNDDIGRIRKYYNKFLGSQLMLNNGSDFWAQRAFVVRDFKEELLEEGDKAFEAVWWPKLYQDPLYIKVARQVKRLWSFPVPTENSKSIALKNAVHELAQIMLQDAAAVYQSLAEWPSPMGALDQRGAWIDLGRRKTAYEPFDPRFDYLSQKYKRPKNTPK